MRTKSEASEMPIFPLFVIGTTALAIILYLVASQALLPKPGGNRVYVPSAYGVSDDLPSAQAMATSSEFTFEKPRHIGAGGL
ncbi:hypothetical protein FHX15_000258 [Rhizobium sp. BK650]|uniref:hypothetical protein n=1 Tax=Rhizobium sp. BK650 TaxID=2586990 RepID=UPI001621D9DE|nr:hypothetical protein [Rhizobium sp. BK650]MBB3655059.1 hypothetical protein [Rhizobium sp. BK650]